MLLLRWDIFLPPLPDFPFPLPADSSCYVQGSDNWLSRKPVCHLCPWGELPIPQFHSVILQRFSFHASIYPSVHWQTLLKLKEILFQVALKSTICSKSAVSVRGDTNRYISRIWVHRGWLFQSDYLTSSCSTGENMPLCIWFHLNFSACCSTATTVFCWRNKQLNLKEQFPKAVSRECLTM